MLFLNKIKWILGTGLIFYIILTTNLVDRDNYNRIQTSIKNIYYDRLIASELLYNISNLINSRLVVEYTQDYNNNSDYDLKFNKKLNQYIDKYSKTYLTRDENLEFDFLVKNIEKLNTIEFRTTDDNTINKTYIAIVEDINNNLNKLIKIQMREGKTQLINSKKAINMIDLLTNIEIVVMIILALGIQFIILYKPKTKELK